MLGWFQNYLSDRKQRAVLPGGSSIWVSINAGVPQGSILGPLLFLIYINDIVKDINSIIRLFADDTSLYIIVDFPEEASQAINQDLVRISAWAEKWLVSFNQNKTEYILLSPKLNKTGGSGLVLDCIDSWSLFSYLLCQFGSCEGFVPDAISM